MMTDQLRCCYNLPWRAQFREKPDGSRQAVGIGSDLINSATSTYNSIFQVKIFNFSIHGDDCYHALLTNESDLATYFTLLSTDTDKVTVPVPTISSKIIFLTGYNVTEYRLNNTNNPDKAGTAIDNFFNFDWKIYATVCLFYLLQLLLVIFWLSMKKIRRSSNQPIIRWITRNILSIARRYIINSNKKLKIVSLCNLFVMLNAFIYFAVLYNTNSLVQVKPYTIDSYESILETRAVLPTFYDLFIPVSQIFQEAPSNSIQNMIWQKSMSMTTDDNFIIRQSRTPRSNNYYNRYSNVIQHHSVIIVHELLSTLNRNFGCSFSRDDEIWKIVQRDVTSEDEKIYGIAMRKQYSHMKQITKRIRLAFEGFIYHQFFVITSRMVASLGYMLTNPTKEHQYEQRVICSDDIKARDTVQMIPSLSILFYLPFIKILLHVLVVALIVLIFECFIHVICKKLTRKVKLPRRREKHLNSRYFRNDAGEIIYLGECSNESIKMSRVMK